MDYSVLIVAAGKQSAKGESYKKALASFNESISVLGKTISIFLKDENCKQVVVVASQADITRVVKLHDTGKIVYVKGGKTRKESVFIGLTAISEDVVLIHDGVRPWLKQPLIDKVLNRMKTEEAVALVLAPKRPVRIVEEGYLGVPLPLVDLIQTQTPQAYKTSLLLSCYAKAMKDNVKYVDDVDVVQQYSEVKIAVEEGDIRNRRFILKNRE